MMCTIADHCHSLTELRCAISEVSDLAEVLMFNSSTLQVLCVDTFSYEDNTIELQTLPQLQSLTFTLFTLDGGYTELVDSFVAKAVRLQKLRVDVGVENSHSSTPLFATACPTLRTLSLFQVNLSTTDLSTTLQQCTNVIILDFDNCLDLTDARMLLITTHLRYLRLVRLVGCPLITDVTLTHLSLHCAHTLQTVWLDKMTQITRDGIDSFRAQCSAVTLQNGVLCCTTQQLEQALSSNSSTILEISLYITNSEAQSQVITSDSVRIIFLHIVDVKSLPAENFKALCCKIPHLQTVVCRMSMYKHMLHCVRNLDPQLQTIKVTTDVAASDLDVLDLPV